ncbi:MAG: PaaI family thioesterase [Candidatus Nanopelagicales bacterium]
MNAHPPDRALAGMTDVGMPIVEQTPALAERRAAVGDLGDALRALITASVATEVPVEELVTVTEEVHRLAHELAAVSRPHSRPSSVDDLRRGRRFYNPVVGPGNPVAPPMRVRIEDGVALGTCTLGLAYEGPLTFAHGGISALLLDQIMGYATAAAGYPGVTGRLQVRYRTAVPLGSPLMVRGEVIDVLGVRVAVRGSIGLAGDDTGALVEADGRFLMLRPEQAQRLFGANTSD